MLRARASPAGPTSAQGRLSSQHHVPRCTPVSAAPRLRDPRPSCDPPRLRDGFHASGWLAPHPRAPNPSRNRQAADVRVSGWLPHRPRAAPRPRDPRPPRDPPRLRDGLHASGWLAPHPRAPNPSRNRRAAGAGGTGRTGRTGRGGRQRAWASSRCKRERLTSTPHANPPSVPSERSTRWQGTKSAGALLAQMLAAARTAVGRPRAVANSV